MPAIRAEPYEFTFDSAHAALLIIDTTVREANDRGYDCLVLADCMGSYFPEFQRAALEMVKAQGGIFGWVGESAGLLPALGKSMAPHDTKTQAEA